MLIGMFAGATVAAKRLGNFLYSDDLVNYVTYEENTTNDTTTKNDQQRVVVVEVKNGAFIWDSIDVEKRRKEEEEEKKDDKENIQDDKENIQQ